MNKKTIQLFVLFILPLFYLTFSSCQGNQEKIKNKKFIIVLDLSDRILVEGQIEKDIEEIVNLRSLFCKLTQNEWEKNDEGFAPENIFEIKIAYQAGNANKDYTKELNELNVDLKSVNDDHPEKLKELLDENNINKFRTSLNKIYSKARFSEKSEDYNGANFHKYFNEDLENHLDKNYDNFVFIITDGYLYFESLPQDNLPNGCYNKMNKLREKAMIFNSDWKEKFVESNLRMKPVNKDFSEFSSQIYLLQIRFEDTYQNEFDFITHVWQDWLINMGLQKLKLFKYSDSPNNIKLINKLILGEDEFIEYTKQNVQEENFEKNKSVVNNQNNSIKKSTNDNNHPINFVDNNLNLSLLSICLEIQNINDRTIYFIENILNLNTEEIEKLRKEDLNKFREALTTTFNNLLNVFPDKDSSKYINYCNKLNEYLYQFRKAGIAYDENNYNLLCKLCKLC